MDFSNDPLAGPWDYATPRGDTVKISEQDLRNAQIPLTPSQFIETTMMMPNPHTRQLENFSFAERRYLRQIYDIQAPRVLLMCGRQVEKSTTLGNKTLSYACLIPHFRILYVSPSSQQTKEFSKTRLKEPLETCPDLKTWFPMHLTDNVFEKKAINRSEIKLRYAFLNADRCLSGSTRIQLADGRAVPIRDLVGTTPQVIAATHDGRAVVAQATRVWSNGVRSVVRVTTDHPLSVTCTPDHRILTWSGWKEARDLVPGDWIAAPHFSKHLQENKESIGEDMAWLIGAMVSEGHSRTKKQVNFTNTDISFIDEFIERAHRCGVKTGTPVRRDNPNKQAWTVNIYSDTRGPGINGGKARLWELGEFGALSHEKRIPSCIFTGSFNEKASFLHALFRGDGWCSLDHRQSRAGYCTASHQLAEDLVHLLWGLGIRCALRVRPACETSLLPRYIVDISSMYTEKLLDLVGQFRAEAHFDADRVRKDVNDRIPISYKSLREHLRSVHGLSTHAAWVKHRIQLRAGNRRDSIGRRVLSEIARKLCDVGSTCSETRQPDRYLSDLAAPDRSWVKVRKVAPAGEEEVFDLSVPEWECVIADGHVVHNCRGLSADLICMDEFQDLLLDNIPVIEEAASHSPFKWFIYSGTPKSLDNSIQVYWDAYSTQNEWAVPCERHGLPNNPGSWHWNILGERNIGIRGLSCDKCGEVIRPDHPMAQWVRTGNPNPKFDVFEGFRIPQLMVPWLEWSNILTKYNQYPRAKFYNEVLGASFDSGQRPLTQGDVQSCCDSDFSFKAEKLKEIMPKIRGKQVYAGIDWGQDSNNSYTIIMIGAYIEGFFRIIFAHRFSGAEAEPKQQIEKIKKLLAAFQIARVGVDYGGGYWPNDELLRLYGSQRVVRYQYSTPKTIMKFDADKGRFLIHRSEVMSAVFNAIKRRSVFKFPKWSEFGSPFGTDMLAIFSEYNERTRMTEYKKSPNTTDDSFHALLLCFIVSMIDNPRPDIIVPSAKIDKELDTD